MAWVTALVRVQSLAQELAYAMGVVKKKRAKLEFPLMLTANKFD